MVWRRILKDLFILVHQVSDILILLLLYEMNPAMRIVEHNSIPRFNPSTGLVEPFIRDPAIQVRRIHGSEQSIFHVIDRYAVA